MAREIPEVVRAAAGLAAIVLDEARKLPETLPGLPVRVIGLAMQSALKVQQQYAGFVARGDELFTGLRGEDEPGLATFDDEIEETDAAPTTGGYRESAFDRADVPAPHDTHGADEPAVDLPARGRAKKAAATRTGPARKAAAKKAPPAKKAAPASRRARKATPDAGDEVLEELAIDEMVGDAPVSAADAAPAGEDVTADVSTTADVLTPDGQVTTVEATVTDEGVAAPEAPADGAGTAAPTDEPEGGSELSGSQAAGTAPIDGYDGFSIAQLRGRLRGYALSTVNDLLAYEQATRAREPYLRMLRNRLERLEAQAVESSPLAPRGV
jgi:hypothetical protein